MAYYQTGKKRRRPGNVKPPTAAKSGPMTYSTESTDQYGNVTSTAPPSQPNTGSPADLAIQRKKTIKQLESQGLKTTNGPTASLAGYDSHKPAAQERAATGQHTNKTQAAVSKLMNSVGKVNQTVKHNAQAAKKATGKSPGSPMHNDESKQKLYGDAKKNVTSLFGKKQRRRGGYYRP